MNTRAHHSGAKSVRSRRLRVLAAAGLVGVGLALAPWGSAADIDRADTATFLRNGSGGPRQALATVTNTSQLRRLAAGASRLVFLVDLEGIVCGVNPEKNELFLQDQFGVFQIGLKIAGQNIQPGARVLVAGHGVIEGTKLLVGAWPLVDNDGLHVSVERSGEVSLPPGRHPFRVIWFDAGGETHLKVFYEGPDLARQEIPASALFCDQAGAKDGTSKPVHGLNFRYFEGTDWTSLPDFERLTPVKAGTVANIDLRVIDRPNNVALEFTGYVDIAREGLYTFSTSSDDGSRVFVGEALARLEVLGAGPPPAPRPVVISQSLSAAEEHQWSAVEGTVTFVSERSDGYDVELSSGAGRMRVSVSGASGDAPPFLLNSQVRAKGICLSTFTSEGQKVAGAMFVLGWRDIEYVRVAAEYWMASPLASIASLRANNHGKSPDAVVRVQGNIRRAAPDAPWVLADETGQIPVEGMLPPSESESSRVEVLGTLSGTGNSGVLHSEFFREIEEIAGGAGAVLPVLTSAKEVHFLNREEAQRGYPARIRGVVIATLAWHNSFLVQDATHGVFIRGILTANPPRLGDLVEVEGVASPGEFAPIILADRFEFLGAGRMPEPLHPTRDQLINGSLDAQYVELQGIVTALEPNGISLLTLAGKYKVELVDVLSPNVPRFENALVRIRGCFLTSWDGQTKQVRIGQIRIFNGSITVDEPAPADLFAAPLKTVGELLLFDASASALKRIKVTGQIVHERAGEYYLMNGADGLRFILKTAMPLARGDQVELVGFPELGGASPVFRESTVRKTGRAEPPPYQALSGDSLLRADLDATLVRIEAQLVGVRAHQSEQVLEMQAGSRMFLARLDHQSGTVGEMRPGSRLQLTGVYSAQGGHRAEGRDIDSFELLLDAPADIKVLEHPSSWTVQRVVMMAGALVAVLLLAFGWIRILRGQVSQQTRKLQGEIEQRKGTETQLKQRTASLETEIEERSRMQQEIERVHQVLLETSRKAGMAEVAISVLHNVGNVLNSVNVSATLLDERLQQSEITQLDRVCELLRNHPNDLGDFLARDPQGRKVPVFLETLAQHLATDRRDGLQEVGELRKNVEHIKEIVAMQQAYARVSGVTETLPLVELVNDAIRINAGSLAQHGVKLDRDFQIRPTITVDKHKALQILVNLIRNAGFACQETGRADQTVTVCITGDNDRVQVAVIDNGVGIAAENLTRIFGHGFTTRKDGHGFGLHSGALAAKEMGGTLTAQSGGPGRGATFIIDLPARPSPVVEQPIEHALSS